MSGLHARLLGWTAELEDDLADPGRTRVFVPSVMGAGILVSLAILLGDLRRALFGRAGEARRGIRVSRAARKLVVPIAAAIDAELPPAPHLRRRLRSRWLYAELCALALGLALYIGIGSTNNYTNRGGYIEGVVWIEVLALAVTAFFLAVAVASAVIAVRYPVMPPWLRPLIDGTPLGRAGAMSPRPDVRTGPAGGAAPDFCLPTSTGRTACLRDFVAHGPVLVWVYRGHWCEHCRSGLAQLRDAHPDLAEQGIQVLAVSPDPPSESERLAADLGLPFVVLADVEHRVAASFGAADGDDILPSAFLVGRRGRIAWAHVGRDQRDQPSARAALAAARGETALPIPAPSTVLTPPIVTAIGIAFAFLALLAAVANHRLISWDRPVSDAIQSLGGESFAALMSGVTHLGSRWVTAPVTVVMAALVWRRCRQLTVVLLGALVASGLLELVLKAVVDRPRPADATALGESFPSGHVLAAIALWGLLPPWTYVMTRRRWAWEVSAGLAGVIILAVGMSRIYLGQHWPSDVLGGLLGGVVFLLAAEWVIRQDAPILHCDACDLHPLRGPPRSGSRPDPAIVDDTDTAGLRARPGRGWVP